MKFLNKLIKQILVLTFLFSVLLILWGRFVESEMLIVKHKDLTLPHWSKRLNNLKVVAISDLHIGLPTVGIEKLKKVVKEANNQKPDLIFLLGDLDTISIADSKINKKKISETLSELHSKYGVVSIMGNHDYYPDTARKIIKDAGIPLLDNKAITYIINGQKLNIVGLEDLWVGNLNFKKAIRKINKRRPTILLSHSPDFFPSVPDFISLTLSGHLHGGQINMPYLGGLAVISKYGQKYIKGHIAEDGKQLYVSAGIGGVPLRVNNPPEIVVLNLHSQDKDHTIISNTIPITGIEYSSIPFLVNLRQDKTFKKVVKFCIK